MSPIDHKAIASRIAKDRFDPYLEASGGGLKAGIGLYDWNIRISGAFHEDLARFEVTFRNALDAALVDYSVSRGWPTPWYQRSELFPGKSGERTRRAIAAAQKRAQQSNGSAEHGKVIAELSFGFWRFLCTKSYSTSLWVPALAGAFPHHPDANNPRAVQADVDSRIERLHFVRDRIAHHEPIFQRDIRRDHREVLDVAGWICTDTRKWITAQSRTLDALNRRPRHQADRTSSSP